MNNTLAPGNVRILVIDDDQQSRDCIESILTREGYQVMRSSTTREGISQVEKQSVDLVITDLRVGDESGMDVIRAMQASFPETEAILITGFGTPECAAEAIQAGAFDYLTKPFSNQHLLVKVQRALERKVMKRELTTLRQHVAMSYGFDNIVGISKPLTQLKETARRVSPTDITILITGPSGSGKELFARTIHYHSNRRAAAFVAMDCSSIPEVLLEAELFGGQPGSPVSSNAHRKGLLEQADGGTLFLDEVSTIPVAIQAKLLRFLQDSEIQPVGSAIAKKVNVRVIAATNRDLKLLVAEGTFREDLYFRLNVIPLNLPKLAERAEDMEMLIDYFLRRIAHETHVSTLSITRRAVDKLAGHSWPGNVRELENTLKRGAALCASHQIDQQDIVFITSDRSASDAETPTRITLTFRGGKLDAEQRTLIMTTLSENDWNFTRTAKELGIGRTTLWRKIKKYNLAKIGALEEVDV